MSSVSIDEARAKLSELIHGLHPGDEVVITEGERPVARLVPAIAGTARTKRQLGTLRGTVTYIAPYIGCAVVFPGDGAAVGTSDISRLWQLPR